MIVTFLIPFARVRLLTCFSSRFLHPSYALSAIITSDVARKSVIKNLKNIVVKNLTCNRV